ncbi:MAG TPA: hypothetical protein VFM25_11715 [Verrucomicrobiae bacterium]|nr:hypothetical protein [Verrucomicrobiae bacterium]
MREGLQSFGGDLTIPVDLPLPGIGTTRLKNIHGSIGYSINGSQNGKPEVYSGRSPTLQVAGSNVSDEGKLTLTATVPDELAVTPDVQLTLRFEPLDPSLPERTASGKITDLLTLGTARFAVTSLAPDFSSATLAVVSGSLKQTLQQQLKAGAEMPPFSQMNLLTRQTITREDLLTGAKNSAGIVFIFGDLQSETGQSFPGYPPSFRGPGSVLPLPPSAVVEQVCVGLKSKVVVVLVTRQISLGFLYGDLRNQTPDYLILSDFIDPLQTAFQLPQSRSRGWSGPSFPIGRDQPSLRQLFNLPEQTLSIVAFNRMGKVLYVKADAGNTFLTSLAEARSALSDQGK